MDDILFLFSFFLSSFIFTNLPSPVISFSYLLYCRCHLRRRSSLFNHHILVAPKQQFLVLSPTQNRDHNQKSHKFESSHKNQRYPEICASKSSLPSMDTAITVLCFNSISKICFSFLDLKLLVLEY